MAEITRGISLTENDSVTNTKFHNLVDLATITNIVNADISPSAAIADTKLAQITTAGKVSATAISALVSLPSSAGYLPLANLPTIPNSSLATLSLLSMVDGNTFKNLTNIPSGAGIIPTANVGSFLGAWVSRSADTVYQAATDGFISGTISGGQLEIFTDSSNPPTTSRQSANITTTRGVVFCCVRKNDYWKATKTGGTVDALYFIPMGS